MGMAKETFAEKLARKGFYSASVQRSWQSHMQAFGPILEPAFVEKYQARVHLTAALNHISSRDIRKGLEKLKKVQKFMETDAEKALVLFVSGLAFEMAGAKDQMVGYYLQAAEFGHRFYLPYLKVAKSAHNDAVFDVAERNYRAGISCFDENSLDDQSRMIVASAYTNLASCLTMMHRFDEAESCFAASRRILPKQPGRETSEAVFYAAAGQGEKAQMLLETTDDLRTEMMKAARQVVDEILGGTHPHFSEVKIEDEGVSAFWNWFAENQAQLLEKLAQEAYEDVTVMMQSELRKVFPFMERELDLGMAPDENGYRVTFADFYMVSLERGYAKLIQACPEVVATKWKFEAAH